VLDYYDSYVDFDIPWSFTFNYSFRYSKNYDVSKQDRVEKIVQTLGFKRPVEHHPQVEDIAIHGWDFTNNELATPA